MRVLGKKLRGEGEKRPPPSACLGLMPLISPCHRIHDNLLPQNQILTYPKT